MKKYIVWVEYSQEEPSIVNESELQSEILKKASGCYISDLKSVSVYEITGDKLLVDLKIG